MRDVYCIYIYAGDHLCPEFPYTREDYKDLYLIPWPTLQVKGLRSRAKMSSADSAERALVASSKSTT